ncbi:MAG: nuclear transport factor 2 family protein [Chitinophagaceae bacterium]
MKQVIMIAMFLSAWIISSAQSKSEKKVADAVQQLKKAMIDPDKAVLDKLVSPYLSYGHSSGKVDTKESFISDLVNAKSDFVSIDLSEQTIAITGKNAIVRHTFNGATLDGGKPGTVKIHVLSIWQKSGSSWKLLARQAVRLT